MLQTGEKLEKIGFFAPLASRETIKTKAQNAVNFLELFSLYSLQTKGDHFANYYHDNLQEKMAHL